MLQEVTREFVDLLHGSLRGRQLHAQYEVREHDVEPYGLCMLVHSSLKPVKFATVELPSSMYRDLLTATFAVHGVAFTCGTVHLESMDTQPVREQQLQIIARHFEEQGCRNAVIAGDFNFDCHRNFSFHYTGAADGVCTEGKDAELDNSCLARLLPDYVDTWRALHPAGSDGTVSVADRGFPGCKTRRFPYNTPETPA